MGSVIARRPLLGRVGLYIVWTWLPAGVALLLGGWVWGYGWNSVGGGIPGFVLMVGTYAGGASAYLGTLLGQSGGVATRTGGNLSVVWRVAGAQVASGVLLCAAMAASVWPRGAYGAAGGVAPVFALFFLGLALLLLSLLSSAVPCVLGAVLGRTVGATLRGGTGRRVASKAVARGGRGFAVAAPIVFGLASVSALLLFLRDGEVWAWGGASLGTALTPRLLVGAVAEMLAWCSLVGSLWACLVALSLLWWDRASDRAMWFLLAPLLGLAAFATWCVAYIPRL